MTQLSREKLEELSNHQHVGAILSDEIAEMARRLLAVEHIAAAAEKLVRCKGRYHSEQNYRALAALFGVTVPDLPPLAAEAQEPVRYLNKFTGVCVTLEQQPDAATDTAVYVPLFAAPQPVAMPDELLAAMEEVLRISDRDHEAWHRARDGIAACRAAMLNAEPVSQPYTLPDGWKLVPVEPTAEMMLHKSGCQRHAWDDQDCSLRQTRRLVWANMLAAAPQEPTK